MDIFNEMNSWLPHSPTPPTLAAWSATHIDVLLLSCWLSFSLLVLDSLDLFRLCEMGFLSCLTQLYCLFLLLLPLLTAIPILINYIILLTLSVLTNNWNWLAWAQCLMSFITCLFFWHNIQQPRMDIDQHWLIHDEETQESICFMKTTSVEFCYCNVVLEIKMKVLVGITEFV